MRSIVALAVVVAALAAASMSAAAAMSYLDNGVIRLGIDLGKGGTITYLANSEGGVNVVNSHDLGREVQQSYYAGPDNFGNPAPPWTNFPWNPIGAGDTYGNAAPVLDQSNDGQTIYTKTAPLQWALNHVPCECLIEQWITLDGNSVKVRNRLTNSRSDHTQYTRKAQELPAAYTNGTFWRLFTYSGFAPYTSGPLTQIVSSPSTWITQFPATEHWAAFVNDSGFGLGVFNSFSTHFSGGFWGTPNIGGPSDDPTGYIGPWAAEILDWNIVYEYDYALVLGTLDQIRAYAVAHRPDGRPDYQFARDRQHFYFNNATDNGWPISGALRVNLNQNDPNIIGPEQWWRAQDVPHLYVTAAYNTSGTSADVFWSVPGESFSGDRRVPFTVIPDGRFHTYMIDLAGSSAYQGTITGIRLDPTEGNDPTGYVDIASITWKSPDYQDLNVDANSTAIKYDALADGLLVIRYLFGLTGAALTNGALASTATRTDPGVIKTYLDAMRPALDIDGSGSADALTDGLLILRYMFGLRGSALIAGAVDPLATRKTVADIEAYIQTLMP